jgi:hypothetical protein
MTIPARFSSGFAEVFEHGIETVGESPRGLLRLATRENDLIYSGCTLAVLDQDGSSLNHRAALLFQVPVAHDARALYEEYDVRNCLLAALYHLNRTIDLYAEMARLFEEIHPDTGTEGNSSDQRIYFEVDAFLVAARHLYDLIAKVLWKHYGRGHSDQWLRIKTALKFTNVIPTEFDAAIRKSWSTYGEKLRAYRDCLLHFVPLTSDASTTVWMNRFDGRWGASVRLPSNPEANSRRAFDTRSTGVDALNYCYGIVSELVGLCEKLIMQPEISVYIASPPSID